MMEEYTLETLLVDIANKRCELQVTNISDQRYDELLDELNILLIHKGRFIDQGLLGNSYKRR